MIHLAGMYYQERIRWATWVRACNCNEACSLVKIIYWSILKIEYPVTCLPTTAYVYAQYVLLFSVMVVNPDWLLSCWMIINCTYFLLKHGVKQCRLYQHFVGRQNVTWRAPLPPKHHVSGHIYMYVPADVVQCKEVNSGAKRAFGGKSLPVEW